MTTKTKTTSDFKMPTTPLLAGHAGVDAGMICYLPLLSWMDPSLGVVITVGDTKFRGTATVKNVPSWGRRVSKSALVADPKGPLSFHFKMLVVDPCYVLQDASRESVDWDDWCPILLKAAGAVEGEPGDEKLPPGVFSLGGGHLGFVTFSGFGDGNYPVYVTRDSDSKVKRVETRFIGR